MTVSPEHGKRYNTRDGQVKGPMSRQECGHMGDGAGCMGDDGGLIWCLDGKYLYGKGSPLDLVSEYIEPTAEPAWIEWHGGECPIKSDKTMGKIRLRDGEESRTTHPVLNCMWNHNGNRNDIIAYRITENHEPAETAPIDMSQNRVPWGLLTDAEKSTLREWAPQHLTYFHQILHTWHKYDSSHGFRDAGVYRTVSPPVITETVHGVEIDGHTVTINITRHNGKPISGTVVV